MLLTLALVVLKLRSAGLVARILRSLLRSSASVPPSTGAEVFAEVPEERCSSPVPACALKLVIPHGYPSSSLPGASNNRAPQGTHQVGMDYCEQWKFFQSCEQYRFM